MVAIGTFHFKNPYTTLHKEPTTDRDIINCYSPCKARTMRESSRTHRPALPRDFTLMISLTPIISVRTNSRPFFHPTIATKSAHSQPARSGFNWARALSSAGCGRAWLYHWPRYNNAPDNNTLPRGLSLPAGSSLSLYF